MVQNKADKYFIELLKDIEENGVWSKNPRTRWKDETPAQYKSVYNKTYTYDINNMEFPITTLRTTPFRGCFEEMRWIYQLQSNIIEDAHPSIHSWWLDFVTKESFTLQKVGEEARIYYPNIIKDCDKDKIDYIKHTRSYIGETYGKIVRKYDLMNKLLYDLEHNSESRRKIINLWDNQSQMEDPKALPPCAYMTNWKIRNSAEAVSEKNGMSVKGLQQIKMVDVTLFQRSRDTVMVYSINPTEYVKLLMMVCGHLTYKTGVLHKPGFLNHHVEDEHVYDRNYWAVEEILNKEPLNIKPKIELICAPKDFYDYRWEDFKISGVEGITPLSKKLEIAI